MSNDTDLEYAMIPSRRLFQSPTGQGMAPSFPFIKRQPAQKRVAFAAMIAGKAFDENWLLEALDNRGATAVTPPKSNQIVQREYDEKAYCWRHLVENYFAKIKEFCGIATRYDKTGNSYAASWHLVAAHITSR